MNILSKINEMEKEGILYLPEPKPKKKRKPPYRKPQSIKELEQLIYIQKKQLHPDFPVLKPRLRDDSANGLTDCIVRYLRLNGHFAARVNTQGNFSKRIGKWTYSGCTKGMSDISAVVFGRHFSIEVKVNRDKPSIHQLKVKTEIEKSGGVYLFVRSFDDFLKQINNFLI